MAEAGTVQSLERAFALIEALARGGATPLTELATAVGLHKSTVHRLLAALTALGYVKKESATGKYRLTLKLTELSGRVVDSIDVLELARAPMERLRDATQEAVHLVVRDGVDIVYVHKVESTTGSVRMFSRIGTRRPLYCTAVGKSLLAAMDDGRIEALWNESDVHAYTAHTMTALPDLLAELAMVRRLEYALDNEENELGVRCIGTAVLDHAGRGRAAISVSAPLSRMSDARIAEIAPLLLAARAEISAGLGWNGSFLT